MNAIIYCRVSSKEQVEGTSLDSQLAACERYAREHDMRVLRTFIEEGESAKFADRTQLLALLNYCRDNKGRVDTLIFWKVDRFSRETTDHFAIKAMLRRYGVSIVSVTEPINATPEGQLMETMLSAIAQFDNDIRAARVIEGMRSKIRDGIFPWKPPLGYVSTRKGREKKNQPDAPDPERFEPIRQAWQEILSGAYTKADIRRLLDLKGVVNRSGRPLSHQDIDNLFRNPYYAGVLVDSRDGSEHTGHHTAMVTAEEFARVQQILARRNRSIPHHKHRQEFPVRGLIRCAECKWYLTSSFSKGRSRKYGYYHCHNSRCMMRGKGLPVAKVDEEVRAYLSEIAPKEELFEKLRDKVLSAASTKEHRANFTKQKANAELERLDRELKELVSMRTRRLISDDEFKAQRTTILDARYELQSEKVERISASEIRKSWIEITQPLLSLVDTWLNMMPALRARFQHLILPMGFMYGKIRTAELGLLFRGFGDCVGAYSNRVHPTLPPWNQLEAEIKAFCEVLREYHESQNPSSTCVPSRTR